MESPQPSLSIVIPVYNRADVVLQTLESVAAQSWRPLKVILVDNASTDNTPEILREWQRKENAPGFEIIVTGETAPGAAAARNRGFMEVSSGFTMFFDSDDIMSPQHVERAMRYVGKHDADIVGWDVSYLTLGGTTSRLHFYAKDPLWHNIMHGGFSTQRYICRTSLLRQAGLWDSSARGWDDIELGTRILACRPAIAKLSGEPTVTVKAMEKSISGTSFASGSEKWEHALDLMEETMSKAGIGIRYADFRRIILAGDYANEGASEKSARLFRKVLSHEKSFFYRMLYQAAYKYVSHGGRGIARLMRIFFR